MKPSTALLETLQTQGPDAVVRHLYSSPQSTLEPYFTDSTYRLIANFFDAAIHDTRQVAALESKLLLNDPKLQFLPQIKAYFHHFDRLLEPWQLFLPRPKSASQPNPYELWAEVEKKKLEPSAKLLDLLNQTCPDPLKPILLRQWNALHAWCKLNQHYRDLLTALDLAGPICYRPFYPYPYLEGVLAPPPPQGDLIIWAEPFSGEPHPHLFDAERHLVLYCADFDHFYQIAVQPAWNRLLSEKTVKIFIGNKHPFDLWQIQAKPSLDISHEFQLYMLQADPSVEPYLKLITEELSRATSEILNQECSTHLYTLGKRLWQTRDSRRYGSSRSAAFTAQVLSYQWYDPYKERPNLDRKLGPEPLDQFEGYLKELSHLRSPRPNLTKKRLKVAHVAQQLVDGGHAPSKLITALLQYCNCAEFEPILIITEGVHYHLEDYPFNLYASYSTIKRAPERLEFLRSLGIPWFIQSPEGLYAQRAQKIAQLLKNEQVDRVIFHGPDVTNLMAAQLCDVPKRILLEHGTLPAYPGFDLVIASTGSEATAAQKQLERLKTKVVGIPFAHDVKDSWPLTLPIRADYKLPEEAFIMTTISNNLGHRLGKEMLNAIVSILKAAPQAFYAPIGSLNEMAIKEFMQFFEQEGVEAQVRFLGHQPDPSHVARMMQVYLNEFPFGSCLGMLDAMASGCPVVSMYDSHGPIQAQYAFSFLGPDYVIRSGKKEDYVAWALKLISDPSFYEKCSKHTLECYSKYSDLKAYVKRVEEAIKLPEEDLLKGYMGNALRS